MILVCSGLF